MRSGVDWADVGSSEYCVYEAWAVAEGGVTGSGCCSEGELAAVSGDSVCVTLSLGGAAAIAEGVVLSDCVWGQLVQVSTAAGDSLG